MNTTILTVALTALMFGGKTCESPEQRNDRLDHEALVRWTEQYDREHPSVVDEDKEAEEREHWEMTHR